MRCLFSVIFVKFGIMKIVLMTKMSKCRTKIKNLLAKNAKLGKITSKITS